MEGMKENQETRSGHCLDWHSPYCNHSLLPRLPSLDIQLPRNKHVTGELWPFLWQEAEQEGQNSYIGLLYPKSITWLCIHIRTRDRRTEILPQQERIPYSLQTSPSKDMRPSNTHVSELEHGTSEASQLPCKQLGRGSAQSSLEIITATVDILLSPYKRP